ncbi:hypothetical protein EDB92DRAFT_1823345 [Lactarius akahatsu]|uniref:Uncharacterized protein n=1 Tax=Lactarius akahatsu TaxID=416441 RepID=A0AAD4Q1Z6_9AGAM|nr:hypothetical protein EDB92DRAFT_1823345 [Lactarius akahatsu]
MTWHAFQKATTVTSFATGIVSGALHIMGGYQTYVSPQTSLTIAWNELEQIQSILDGLSNSRKRHIEIAARNGLCKSLQTIRDEVEGLRDRYYLLGIHLAESSGLLDSHIPTKQFRHSINDLRDDIKAILQDTMVITILFPDARPIESLASVNNRIWHGPNQAGCFRELNGENARRLSICLPNWVGNRTTGLVDHTKFW